MATGDPLGSAGEAELVERFRSTGENQYFEELYRATRRKVFGVCCKILRNPAAAEDMAHEAFLHAYERFRSLEGANFSAWVCRIAANLCLNRIRDEKTRERLLDAEFAGQREEGSDPPESGAISAEEIRIALRVIESLTLEQRKVLLLRCLDGCSYREIERITGYESGQVRSYLQNARRNFQLRWQEKVGAVEGAPDGSGKV